MRNEQLPAKPKWAEESIGKLGPLARGLGPKPTPGLNGPWATPNGTKIIPERPSWANKFKFGRWIHAVYGTMLNDNVCSCTDWLSGNVPKTFLTELAQVKAFCQEVCEFVGRLYSFGGCSC